MSNCPAEPLYGFGLVCGNADALSITFTQSPLCVGFSLVRLPAVQIYNFFFDLIGKLAQGID